MNVDEVTFRYQSFSKLQGDFLCRKSYDSVAGCDYMATSTIECHVFQ